MNIQQINAAAEGWTLAHTDSGPRIRKDDESSLFASDDHALEVLQERAAAGSDTLAASALTHHYASIAGLDVDPVGLVAATRAVIASHDDASLAAADQHLSEILSRL